LPHQAGGVADARDVADVGLDFEIVKVRAAEYDSRVSRSGNETHATAHGGVQTDSLGFDGALDGELKGHGSWTVNICASLCPLKELFKLLDSMCYREGGDLNPIGVASIQQLGRF
jgi:hypothetical protein